MRTNRRTPEEQLEMVRLCRVSGLTIAEWCRREGIKSDTYYTWIERLQKRGMLEKAAPVPQKIVSQPFSPEIVRVQVEAPSQQIKYLNLPVGGKVILGQKISLPPTAISASIRLSRRSSLSSRLL